MKYRKKPVVIEAYQTDKELDIETLEGTMHASVGDYIITGVRGEQYPCKPDIFEQTYEPAAQPDMSEYSDKLWKNAYERGKKEAQRTGRWIPVSERPPEDLEEVNITFTNLEPEPYYDFIKGKRFTGSAVFYKGEWYWYSSITVDVLKEYGRYDSEKIDEGIKIIAWQSLPEPYREVEE